MSLHKQSQESDLGEEMSERWSDHPLSTFSSEEVDATERPDLGRHGRHGQSGLSNAARGFRRTLLIQVVLCAIPASVFLGFGKVIYAGIYFWVTLAIAVIRLLILGHRKQLLCLLIALVPLINLLREISLYNTVSMIFALALIVNIVAEPKRILDIVRRSPVVMGLIVFVVIYYALSFIFTLRYVTNLRMFELVFSALAILLVGRNRQMLGFALLGLVISGMAVGVAMLPHVSTFDVQRLGMIMVEGYVLGDPAQLGAQMSIAIFILAADGGRWINFQNKGLPRILLIVPAVMLLALSTSRTSWIIVLVGVITLLFFGSGTRLRLLMFLGFGIIALELISLTPFGEGYQKGLNRTFGDDRGDLSHRTNGRTDMWLVGYRAFTSSLRSAIYGSGPGTGSRTYSRVSVLAPGVQYAVGGTPAIHSLYVQLAIEAGLLGLLPFMLGIILVFRKILASMKESPEFVPLLCFFAYTIIIGSSSGTDTGTGIFLGLALLGGMGASYFMDNARSSPRRNPVVEGGDPTIAV